MDEAIDDTIVAGFRALFVGRSALVLEDEPAVAGHIALMLRQAGFSDVMVCATGELACDWARRRDFDVLILDRQTPGMDGASALRHIRAGDPATGSTHAPAIFLTALGGDRHRIEGLAGGADDYIVKPVSDEELLARVAALLRRRGWERRADAAVERDEIVSGPLTIRKRAAIAVLCGQRLELTGREFAILTTLAENIGLPVTRSMLWSTCWPTYSFEPDTFANTIDVHVSRLRRKLEAAAGCLLPTQLPLITAVRAQGIMLRSLEGAAP